MGKRRSEPGPFGGNPVIIARTYTFYYGKKTFEMGLTARAG
jgi:hypothetical protein